MAPVEKITRTIYIPCKGLALRHMVSFGSKSKSGNRLSELYSYEYKTNKYSDVNKLSAFTLDTSDYILFEPTGNKEDNDNKSVLLSYPHMFKLKRALKEVMKWFYDDEYEDLFLQDSDNSIILNSKYKNLGITAYQLVMNKNILFEPAVIEFESQQYEGCIMYLNSYNDYFEMTLDQVEALYDFIKDFNLYESSLQLINYVTSVNGTEIKDSSISTTNSAYKPRSSRRKGDVNDSEE